MSAHPSPDPRPYSYLPFPARLTTVIDESPDTRTFVLGLEPPVAALDGAQPGQFVMLSLLGIGEAPFTMSALPGAGGTPGTVVLTVRRMGVLTTALFALTPGARVGVRGPFGRGFPDADPVPTLYVAGGCGLAPLRAAIVCELAQPRAAPLAIVYGARDPVTRIFKTDLARWRHTPGVRMFERVDHADETWDGRVGSVVDDIAEAVAAIGATRAVVCGPPAMSALAAAELLRAGLDAGAVYVALERYMKCGTGQCGHCYVNQRYVCTDGPVFTLSELCVLPETWTANSGFAALRNPPAGPCHR